MSASAVRNSVANFHGSVTWEYSQSDWSTLKLILMHAHARWGICKSLSAQWIVDHAYGGALYNRVVGADGKINPSAITKIRNDFVALWNNQSTATSEWMRVRGLLRRGTSRTFEYDNIRNGVRFKGFSLDRGDMGHSAKNDPGLPQRVADTLRGIGARESRVRMGGSYCMIDFGGKGSGHAVAAWVAQDALFFDPNNGEYWFENANHFFDWFPRFYQAAGYGGWPLNFLRRWSVEEYALAARGMEHRAR